MRKLDPKKHPKLIAFLEKTAKILKTVAVICFSLVIVLCVFFYTKACSEKNAAQLINASAEESTTFANTVEKVVDTTKYPSANLFYIRDYEETQNGLTLTVIDDVLTMKGTTTAICSFWLLNMQPLLAGTYSFASEKTPFTCFLYFNGTSERVEIYNGLYSNLTKTITSTSTWLQIVVGQGVTVDVSFGLMCNAGEVAYPFIPPLDRIYYNGYNVGYEAGETDGKESGYNDGLAQAAYGMWRGSTVSVSASVSGSSFSWSGTPEYFSEGVGFSAIYEQFKNNENLLNAPIKTINLNFATPVRFVKNAFRATALFSPSISQGTFLYAVSSDGVKQGIYATDLDESGAYVFNIPEGVFTSIQIEATKWEVLQQLSFFSYEPYFEQGYEAGYQAGYNNKGAYNDGYKNGYNVGKSDGFQEGFNQSEKGSFGWLISSVQEFLNVNFFGGFGIGTLVYVGLGLTLVSIFLRVFAGG